MTQDADAVRMPTIADQWLGAGLPFPIRPDGGRITDISGIALVRQAMDHPRHRAGGTDHVARLRVWTAPLLDEPNTLATRTSMETDITSALKRWEPRIRMMNVAVTPGEDPSLVWIEIAYVRVADLSPDNLVYPFYLR